MSQRRSLRIAGVLSTVAALEGTVSMAQAPPTVPESAPETTTALKTTNRVKFTDAKGIVWQGTPVCDANSNVYYVPYPTVDPRDLRALQKDPSARPRFAKKPSEILRISATGKQTLFDPARTKVVERSDGIRTGDIALDASGTLHALVSVTRDQNLRQYLVSFEDDGRYRSHIEIQQEEITAGRVVFFGSGSVLVFGNRNPLGPRVAIMSAGGESFVDVGALPGSSVTPRIEHPVRGGDGRIYFLTPSKDAVYVMGAWGGIDVAFELASMPSDHRLVSLQAAGSRLAVTYRQGETNHSPFWMAVYSTAINERVAIYGPSKHSAACYGYEDGRDLFKLFQPPNLVTLAGS